MRNISKGLSTLLVYEFLKLNAIAYLVSHLTLDQNLQLTFELKTF